VALVVRELLTVLGVKADDANVKKFERAVRGAKGAMQEATTQASVLKIALGNLAATGFQVVVNVLRDVTTGLLDANVAAGFLRAGLVGATGSVDAAADAWERLLVFAEKTPFQVEGIVAAFTRLANVGLKNTNRELTAFGDIAAATPGKKIEQVVEAVADATLGQFERLNEFAIKAQKEGSKIAIVFKGVKTLVNNDAESIQNALVKLSETNFAGAMERQSKTLGGAISNMKDAAFRFAVAVGDAGASAALEELIRTMIGGAAGAGSLAKTIGVALAKAIRALNQLLITLGRNMETVRKSTVALGLAFAALGVMKVVKAISSLVTAMTALSASMIIPVIKAVLLAIAIVLIALAIDDLIGFMEGKKSVIGDILGEDSDEATSLRDALLDLRDGYTEMMAEVNSALADFDLTIWDVIIGLIKAVVVVTAAWAFAMITAGKWIAQVSGDVFAFSRDVQEWIGNRASGAIDRWSDRWEWLSDRIAGAPDRWQKRLGDFWDWFTGAIVEAVTDAWNLNVAIFTAIGDAFIFVFMFILDLAASFVELVVDIFWGIVDGIGEIGTAMGEAFESAFGVVVDTISGWISDIIELFGDLVDLVETIGSEVEVFFGGEGVEGGLAGRAAALTQATAGATQTAAQTAAGGQTSSIVIGEVGVQIGGGTNMTGNEVAGAVQEGVFESVDEIVRRQMRGV
jgi:hypothetical protein